jgi:hypothetical protein
MTTRNRRASAGTAVQAWIKAERVPPPPYSPSTPSGPFASRIRRAVA